MFLGIDYGLAKIGLSLSEGELARPLAVLKVKSQEDAMRKLMLTIAQQKINTIIFGIPTPDTIGAAKFADKLSQLSQTEIVKIDETLTTKLALPKKKKSSSEEDSRAASILLQEFLDARKDEKFVI